MTRNETITRLRRAGVANEMWRGIADDGILGPLTADVEHSAAIGLRDAIVEARKHGLTVGEIVNETLIPYSTVFLLTR